MSQFNDTNRNTSKTFYNTNSCITNNIDTVNDDKNGSDSNTNDNVNCNTIAMYRKDGLPNVRVFAVMIEMLYDEHAQRAVIEFTEMNVRLVSHQ